MHDFIAATVYYIISIVLFPVSLLGYVIWVGKGFLKGNPSGVSATAQGPLSTRWAMHNLGTRQDEPANRLMPLLPGVPPVASRMASFPTLLAHRVTGYVPKAFRYPFEGDVPKQYEASARVTFFDDAVDRYLAAMDQFVILGAGFDTRPYRLPKDTRVRSFELDVPRTQAVKREMLTKAGIDSSAVTFVATDFEKEDWLARLVDSGFDPAKPALFLWEGVMVYLDRAAVETPCTRSPAPPRAASSRSTTSRPSPSCRTRSIGAMEERRRARLVNRSSSGSTAPRRRTSVCRSSSGRAD